MINKFAERLKELRLSKGLTQKRLGEDLKIPAVNIKNWENDFNGTDFDTLILIARYFRVSVDYLVGNKEKRVRRKAIK